MSLPNFNLTAGGPISNSFILEGVDTFHKAIRHIQSLPYGRSKLEFPNNILIDNKGTCSTKHACIKELASENNIHSIELNLCIYAMTEKNTPGVGIILDRYKLDYMLEAHVYLTYDDVRYDFTFDRDTEITWVNDILMETSIDVDQITDFKINYHKNVLKEWIKRDNLSFSLQDMWEIRESCISRLGNVDL